MGNVIERLTSLPQPDFERGYKGLIQVGVRRVAKIPMISWHLPALIDRFYDPFLPAEVRVAKASFKHAIKQLEDKEADLLSTNVFFTHSGPYLRASPFHVDTWLRDAFFSCLALSEPETELAILNRFLRFQGYQGADGHVPTTILLGSNRRWYFDDESTALAIIWRAKLAELGVSLGKAEKTGWLEALGYVRAHFQDGFYVTHGGKENSWFDTFKFPKNDVVTYTHGIATTALLAAQQMELGVKTEEIKQAVDAYSQLSRPAGALKLSRKTDYVDVSSLVGTFLAATLFHASFLDQQTARVTLDSFHYAGPNLKIVCKVNGDCLEPYLFNKPCPAGEYQNGGSWPLFNVLAEKVRQIHGLGIDRDRLQKEQTQMDLSDNAEWRWGTNSSDTPIFDRRKVNHTWTVTARVLIREMLAA